jgi:hypothetical protein
MRWILPNEMKPIRRAAAPAFWLRGFELSDPETRGCRSWYLHGGARPPFCFSMRCRLSEYEPDAVGR